ncbi:hypothetical protein SK128_023446 [Halocaridina rubra]|uniref:Uncharacterized protein n=1 Tax=Halocaridina rubra TaxID=373956 RepID=A0AAN8X6E5_HALRR
MSEISNNKYPDEGSTGSRGISAQTADISSTRMRKRTLNITEGFMVGGRIISRKGDVNNVYLLCIVEVKTKRYSKPTVTGEVVNDTPLTFVS